MIQAIVGALCGVALFYILADLYAYTCIGQAGNVRRQMVVRDYVRRGLRQAH